MYVMTYFHPRDFDANPQMVPGLELSRRFMNYVGIAGAENKLRQILSSYSLAGVDGASKLISWDSVPIVNLEQTVCAS